jgi:outer membrane protein
MRQLFLCAVLAAGFSVNGAHAGELPLWEAGLGVAGLTFPDYRGSDQQRGYVLPLPYIQYRGKVFRIDREGAHEELFTSDRIKLDLSMAVGPPAKSDKSDARSGMPDLKPTVEVGPALHVYLARNQRRDREWSLRLPLRTAEVVSFSQTKNIGWVFAPSLNFEAFTVGGGWDIDTAIGPIYATESYNDYYYEVAPGFATATRPAYDARAGYSGSRLTITMSRRYPKFWVGAFARYDNLSGAVFVDSPLVKRKDSFMAGIGIAWILAQSRSP